MLIHEIFRKTAVTEAFPVKGMTAQTAPTGLSTSTISNVAAKGLPTKPTLASRIKSAASSGLQAIKSAGTGTAEYLAHKALTGLGVPDDQIRQMNWDPKGMIVQSGKGSAAIQQAQNHIAEKLVREYLRTSTLNGTPVPNLTDQDIDAAIKLSNDAGQRLPIDVAKTREVFNNYLLTQVQQSKASILPKRNKPAAPGSAAMNQMASQLTAPAAAPAPASTPAAAPAPAPQPPKPRIQRLPGETVQAAIQRAQQGQTQTKAPVKKTRKTKTPAKQPTWTGRKQKVSTPPSGAPTADEYANFEKKVQQALAAQGEQK